MYCADSRTAASTASVVYCSLWCASYLCFSPDRISMASSMLGSGTSAG